MTKVNMIELLYECTIALNEVSKDLFGVKEAFPDGVVNYMQYKPMQQLYENAVLYRLGKEIPDIEYTDKEFLDRVNAIAPNVYSYAALEEKIKGITLEEMYDKNFINKMDETRKLIADTIESVFEKHLGKKVYGKFTKDITSTSNKGNQLN